MKCDELTPIDLECNMGKDSVTGLVNREPWKAYDIDEVDAAIAELKSENKMLKEHIANGDVSRITWIDEVTELKAKNRVLQSFYDIHGNVDNYIDQLKAKLESVQATAYADSVDAGMRERRLKRALYKVCAMWAKCEERINNRDAYDASEYLPSAEDKFRKREKRWGEMATKCIEKMEEYK